jgi:hypothetical protein
MPLMGSARREMGVVQFDLTTKCSATHMAVHWVVDAAMLSIQACLMPVLHTCEPLDRKCRRFSRQAQVSRAGMQNERGAGHNTHHRDSTNFGFYPIAEASLLLSPHYASLRDHASAPGGIGLLVVKTKPTVTGTQHARCWLAGAGNPSRP